jgi:hypothetical protein
MFARISEDRNLLIKMVCKCSLTQATHRKVIRILIIFELKPAHPVIIAGHKMQTFICKKLCEINSKKEKQKM